MEMWPRFGNHCACRCLNPNGAEPLAGTALQYEFLKGSLAFKISKYIFADKMTLLKMLNEISYDLPLIMLCSRWLMQTPMRDISTYTLLAGEQGKSEGFESCDRPIDRKRPIWVKIGDVLSRVTLKFDGWPWKTIGHLLFAVSSFVQHFIAIGEFKLELQSGNAQFESNLTISWAMWPWNLTDDLEKQYGTSSMLLQALCIIS